MPRHRAYTLIEVLTAIAVIGLLLGILLPALGYARRAGQSARCKSNLGQIAKCFTLFAEDHNGSPPDEESKVSWDEQLLKYTRDRQVYLCPGDKSAVSRDIGLSYWWRDTITVGEFISASAADVNLLAAEPNTVILVYELKKELHRSDYLNASMINSSVYEYTLDEFFKDIEVPVN